jgi:glycerol-3-phosphate dehydrogenase
VAPAVAALSPQLRDQSLQRMAEAELDLVVIGGGVVGAGAALDAAIRGLRVGLVEARDWASGTSSRSSKLIHGGLRYLEMLDLRLVREALRERALLLRVLAPHLVEPVPFLFPLTHRVWERAYVGAGVLLYDTMGYASGRSRGLPRHRHLSRRQALRRFPSLREDALVGAIEYYDAKVDDARYVVTLARTAATHGVLCANRAQVVAFLRDGPQVVGVRVRDLDRGGDVEIRARAAINATGVWTDDTQALVGLTGGFHVRASKGIHLVVPADRLDAGTGLILRTATSVLFVIPWGAHWIIGTTDTDWKLDKAHPAASALDIAYLLDQVNRVLRVPLTRDDVQGVYAGLRPLLAGESELTSKLSREHVVGRPAPGLVVVAGGKYTTYRVMAEDAVDAAVAELGGLNTGPSRTQTVQLAGAEGFAALWGARHRVAQRHGIPVATAERLLRRYGTLVEELLAPAAERPQLAHPVPGAEGYIAAELLYAASHEGARHLDDVLTRRTRISIETWDRGLSASALTAELIAPVLGWEPEQVAREVEYYRLRVAAERESQDQPDDRTADVTRLGAPEIAPLA